MEEAKVYLNMEDYENLVRESEKYNMIKNAFFSCVRKTDYGVTINDNYMIAVIASACPEEYIKWCESSTVDDE